jgi:DNA-3-methyladenine glycosylase II
LIVPVRLTEADLVVAATELAARDNELRQILHTHGPPPLWARPASFSTLIRIILEQQVSLASAASMFARLRQQIVPFQPQRFLELGDSGLKALGLTRQKSSYCLHLAESIVEKRINLSRLARMSDEAAKASLVQLRGIGSWSADVYLLMALRRPDAWPAGDLALALAMANVKQLGSTPRFEEMERLAENWRPFRAVAARMLWQHYLARRAERSVR